MPDVAKYALEQFQHFDNAIRRKYYYLNYLEPETWRYIENKKGHPLRQSFARTPLQVIGINYSIFPLINIFRGQTIAFSLPAFPWI